jgi:D-amino-acid oxidase
MAAETPSSIIVLGAGVIGLSIAHTLIYDHDYHGASITILARDMPGDLDSQAFASPWAVSLNFVLVMSMKLIDCLKGADWSPIGGTKESRAYQWEQNT